MNKGILNYPTIEEPDDMLEDDEFLLKWDDFQYDPNTEMKHQRQDNVKQQVLDMLRIKIGHLPSGVMFRGSELPLNEKNLKSGAKYGYLIRVKHGFYMLNLPDQNEE